MELQQSHSVGRSKPYIFHTFGSAERLDVLCCCKPENVLGSLPAISQELPAKQTKNEEDIEGWAFSSNGLALPALERIEGFEMAKGTRKGGRKGTKKGTRKGTRKTWKEK